MNASALYEAASRFVAIQRGHTDHTLSLRDVSVRVRIGMLQGLEKGSGAGCGGGEACAPAAAAPRHAGPAQRPPHADAGRIGQLLLDQSVMEGYSSVLVKHTATVCALAAHGFASAYISLRDYEGYRR
eukprot:CAMPEP_0169459776 /NCGR_PEP_ID=MMETSP1042-20121227/18129_1 /TAXON_ID=464988 /ORGANISM="Hemiselmis andersenii, Strain CCMP1180" /LENGTH=127 /DNA_ID=CAMNT_0009572213 /DNA_START=109 /DNA_END=487 /DNA_ORIENTATION=+